MGTLIAGLQHMAAVFIDTPPLCQCRGVHEDVAAKVNPGSQAEQPCGADGGKTRPGVPSPTAGPMPGSAERACACPCCRWFILKDGKIFWFKSDIVGPVRRSLPLALLPRRGCRCHPLTPRLQPCADSCPAPCCVAARLMLVHPSRSAPPAEHAATRHHRGEQVPVHQRRRGRHQQAARL